MSEDRFTETTSQSWLSRIGGAIKGIVLGLVLFVVAFPLLFWNEGRSLTTYKSLKEGGSTVVTVASDSIDPANAGRLIHLSGLASTEVTLTDSVFAVSAQALKLKRNSEMYQWQEESHSETTTKIGGSTETVTEYSYSKAWLPKLVSSNTFKHPSGHQNPSSMPYSSTQYIADRVTLDAFTLSPALLGKINSFEPLVIDSDTPLPTALNSTAQVYDAGFYIGASPANPLVGDVRVKFEMVRPVNISVIAKQVGNSFAPYVTQASGSIELLQIGEHTAEAMIAQAQADNVMLTWLIRLGGFVCMMVGLNLILRPLSVIADVLPIAGTIVGAGAGLIAFLVAAPLSLLTIAMAWLFYRPLLGIALIVIAGGLTMLLKAKLKAARNAAETAAASS